METETSVDVILGTAAVTATASSVGAQCHAAVIEKRCRGENSCRVSLVAALIDVASDHFASGNTPLMSEQTASPLPRLLALITATALAACTGGTTAGQLVPTPASGPTAQQAKAECWMKYEGDKAAPRDLDKRVKLVEKCVDDKLHAQSAQ
jgi:hypothetical protein